MQNVFKVNGRDCVLYQQLATCLKLCSSVFLVDYNHVFVHCDVFVITICFSMSLIASLNKFDKTRTSYWELVFKQSCSLKLQKIKKKHLRQGLLIKLQVWRAVTMLKIDSITSVSREIFEKSTSGCFSESFARIG